MAWCWYLNYLLTNIPAWLRYLHYLDIPGSVLSLSTLILLFSKLFPSGRTGLDNDVTMLSPSGQITRV